MLHETMEAYIIVLHLKELFDIRELLDKHVRYERFGVLKLLSITKMQVGTCLVHHTLKINTYIERLGQVGFIMDHELCIDWILSSLIYNFVQFVLNY